MKIITVIGARPQFIKASVVSKAIARHSSLQEVIVHTGQHFDANMSSVFFEQLGIPKPDYQLDVNGGSHGDMTGRMLIEIEKIILAEAPQMVMVYGDTNSTLAGALAAAKLNIPVSHVEAGLRSFNMQMPEEINRILTDRISQVLFCPTQTAIDNLSNEGIPAYHKGATVLNVGDVMQDAAMLFSANAVSPAGLHGQSDYILATIHRAENTDDPVRLQSIVTALNELHQSYKPVILPLHPRTRNMIAAQGIELNVHVMEPVGYFEMLWLLKHSAVVVTDSGGLQKEAFFFAKPCVTIRDQTEWVELIQNDANILAGTATDKILSGVKVMASKTISDPHNLYGGGTASARIAEYLSAYKASIPS